MFFQTVVPEIRDSEIGMPASLRVSDGLSIFGDNLVFQFFFKKFNTHIVWVHVAICLRAPCSKVASYSL